MIPGYAGVSDKLDQALASFAHAYADQTEADHAQLVAAVRKGRLPIVDGALEQSGSAFRPRPVRSPENHEPDGPQGADEE